MKKKHIKRMACILCFATLMTTPVHADGDGDEINWGDDYTIRADGESDRRGYSDTTIDTDTSSETGTSRTTHQSAESINRRNLRRENKNMWDAFQREKFGDSVDAKTFYDLTHDGNVDLTSFDYTQMDKKEMANKLNKTLEYRDSLDDDYFRWENKLTPVSPTYDTATGYDDLTDEQKQTVKDGIMERENGQIRTSNQRTGNGVRRIRTDNGRIDVTPSGPRAPSVPEYGNRARRDILKFPAWDANYYADRYKKLLLEGLREGWPTERDRTNNTYRFAEPSNLAWNNVSNVLTDKFTILYFKDYHINTVEKDIIRNVDYQSDERRWHIEKDGVAVCDPIITDNWQHELNFGEVVAQYGAGSYTVVAEQLAKVTRDISVSYDIGEYLINLDTGAVLLSTESKVTNGGGRKIDVGTEVTDEWVQVLTRNVRVNDLGVVEVESSGTQREE